MLSRHGINVRNYSDCLRSNITLISARTPTISVYARTSESLKFFRRHARADNFRRGPTSQTYDMSNAVASTYRPTTTRQKISINSRKMAIHLQFALRRHGSVLRIRKSIDTACVYSFSQSRPRLFATNVPVLTFKTVSHRHAKETTLLLFKM